MEFGLGVVAGGKRMNINRVQKMAENKPCGTSPFRTEKDENEKEAEEK